MPHSRDLDFFRSWTEPWFGFDFAKINVGHVAQLLRYRQRFQGPWAERPVFA